MKRFKDLTEIEIKDLSVLELGRFINLELAENGIPLIDKPLKPEYAKDIESDTIEYAICRGYSTVYAYFANEEDAKKVADLMNKCEFTDKDKNLFSVSARRGYTPIAEVRQKQVESVNRKIKAKYEKLLEEYNKYDDAYGEISKPIIEKHEEIRAKYDRLDYIKRKYSETYLPLAENNEEIAKRFLKDAFAITEEDEKYVFS